MQASTHKGSSCGRMTIRVEGSLDPASANKTLDRIAELPCDDLVVDLGHATEISDVVLAFFLGALTRMRHSNVALRGLDHHQARLVVHLGQAPVIERAHAGAA